MKHLGDITLIRGDEIEPVDCIIGGFPLCWETIHGKGSARWTSEIEEFPIAVTKLRFPEDTHD